MKAFVAIDGSTCSFRAIVGCCDILSADRDELVLYYSPPSAGGSIASGLVERGQSELADEILGEAVKYVPATWSAVHKIVGQGDPRTEIVRVAQESKADLIAVGARGLGAVARLILGSVSRTVVHCSTAPVLIAQEQGVARK